MKYAVIKADGTHQTHEGEGRLNLDILQQTVAAPNEDRGMVEAVSGPHVTIYMNENGKFLPLATNVATTVYARRKGMIFSSDSIKGDCLITGGPDEQGYDMDVDEEVLAQILRYQS